MKRGGRVGWMRGPARRGGWVLMRARYCVACPACGYRIEVGDSMAWESALGQLYCLCCFGRIHPGREIRIIERGGK